MFACANATLWWCGRATGRSRPASRFARPSENSSGWLKCLRNTLTISEIALSTVLLIGAGLLTRSVVGLLNVNPGFGTQNILTLAVSLPKYSHADANGQTAVYTRLLEELPALPGVKVWTGRSTCYHTHTCEDAIRRHVNGLRNVCRCISSTRWNFSSCLLCASAASDGRRSPGGPSLRIGSNSCPYCEI